MLNYRRTVRHRVSVLINLQHAKVDGGELFTIFDSFASIRVHLRLFLFCFLTVLVASAQAAPPVLRALEPRGAQRGQALKVTLVGDSLQAGAEITTTLPGAFSRLTSSPEKGESELPLLLTAKGRRCTWPVSQFESGQKMDFQMSSSLRLELCQRRWKPSLS